MIQNTKNKQVYQSRDGGCPVTEMYRCSCWQMVEQFLLHHQQVSVIPVRHVVSWSNFLQRDEMVIKTLYDLPTEFEYERLNLSLHPQAYKP
jgi:hypothetical protein